MTTETDRPLVARAAIIDALARAHDLGISGLTTLQLSRWCRGRIAIDTIEVERRCELLAVEDPPPIERGHHETWHLS